MSVSKIWTVLIGINFYPNPSNRLRGAVNDISDIELTLRESYSAINVIKFIARVTGDTDQRAPSEPAHLWPTWDNITAALKTVAEQASPDDAVYIHYSGHGTLRSTASSGHDYQEDYGTDAALVLLDAHAAEGIRYLRGIELALLLDEMASRGLRLTVVLDACHSGSISRTEYASVRGVPWNADVAAAFPFQVPTSETHAPPARDFYRDAATENQWLLHPRGYSLLAACGPHESAKEIHVGKERYHGALSYHVLEALTFHSRTQVQRVTHEVIYRRICAKMYIKIATQHPVLIGHEASTFWDTKDIAKTPSSVCEIVQVSPNAEIWLNVGSVHGACIGEEYVVQSREGATDTSSKLIITDVQAVYSVAERISCEAREEDGSRVSVGCSATLTSLARPRAHIKLFPSAGALLRGLIEQSTWLQAIPLEEQASIDIPCFSIRVANSQEYAVLDAKGSPISNIPPNKTSSIGAEQRMVTVLEHLAKFDFVQSLDNRRADGLLESDFRIEARAMNSPSNMLSEDQIEIQDGEKLEITFFNLTQGVLHLAILNLTPLRRIKKMYPPQKEYQTVLPQETRDILSTSVPDDVAPPGRVRLAPRMTIPRRMKDHGGLHAQDVLKFIVSTSPVRGAASMELPDLWDRGATGESNPDESFAFQIRSGFGDEQEQLSRLTGEEPPTKWACRAITVRTVVKGESVRAEQSGMPLANAG